MTGASLDVRPLDRRTLSAAIDDLARLRIAVFRDWPYLYDGDLAYERDYLAPYLDSPGSIVVGAFEGPQLVGAATGTPMEDHAAEFAAPLAQLGLAPDRVFYCAESVLLPDYRGKGVGHRFFDLREGHALALGRSHSVFCAVRRPGDHPARPADYTPLDPFWRKRGYREVPGAVAEFAWKDLGDDAETRKPLQVWMKDLHPPSSR